MEKLMCKKGFRANGFDYIEGEMYFYWNNFQGLNHFISDKEYSTDNENIIPFDGDNSTFWPIKNQEPPWEQGSIRRSYLYDYFYTKEEMRNIKINKIIKNC